MNTSFLDYYSIQPVTSWIHEALCSVMPEALAIFIECVVIGVVIVALYAVLAIILIYMERKVCAAFQCRIGPNRVGGKGGLLQVPADVLKILTKEIIRLKNSDHLLYDLAPYLVILASILSFSCLPWNKGAHILDMNIGILFVLAASSIGVVGILLAGWASNNKYTMIGAVRSGAMIISYELSLGIIVLSMVVLSETASISGIVESQANGWNLFKGHAIAILAFVVYLADVGSGQPYLVPVARVPVCSLAAYDLLRKLARDGIGYRLPYIAGPSHPHGLVDIAPA